jgi:hypothetical protein|tara:strand:+ start:484 stop:708 length:225 start_codon:yes stop_codon:yes gene_type:complete
MINELLTHEDPWVREKASHINQLEEMHRDGEISTEEYVELLEDITRTEMVLDNNANVNGMTLIIKVVTGLLKLV